MPKKTKSKVSASSSRESTTGGKGGSASGGKSQMGGEASLIQSAKISINPTLILEDLKDRFLKDPISAGLLVLALVLIVLGIFFALPKNEDSEIKVIEEPQTESGEVVVDVAGAVLKPGVYKLSGGARVSEAISAAGGFSPNVDSDFISKGINLAQKVSDGAKIYIPKKGENVQSISSNDSSASISGKININSATQVQLESLPGIGPVTAGKIITQRPYTAVEDLLSKKVVGQKTFEKIKGAISVF